MNKIVFAIGMYLLTAVAQASVMTTVMQPVAPPASFMAVAITPTEFSASYSALVPYSSVSESDGAVLSQSRITPGASASLRATMSGDGSTGDLLASAELEYDAIVSGADGLLPLSVTAAGALDCVISRK